jgi:hypothetical protein
VGRRALCVGTRVADYDEEAIGMNDRYRGITGRRDVVFVNERDLASRGLKHGDLVDVSVVPNAGSQPGERVMRYLTAVAYKIAQARLQPIIPKPMPWWRSIITTSNLERRPTNRLRFCCALQRTLQRTMKYRVGWVRPPIDKSKFHDEHCKSARAPEKIARDRMKTSGIAPRHLERRS